MFNSVFTISIKLIVVINKYYNMDSIDINTEQYTYEYITYGNVRSMNVEIRNTIKQKMQEVEITGCNYNIINLIVSFLPDWESSKHIMKDEFNTALNFENVEFTVFGYARNAYASDDNNIYSSYESYGKEVLMTVLNKYVCNLILSVTYRKSNDKFGPNLLHSNCVIGFHVDPVTL